MDHHAGCRAVRPPRPARVPSLAEPLERRQLLAASVSALTPINADTDQPVPGVVLENGAVIDLAQTGRRLNIRADVSKPGGSVRFNYDGNARYKLESSAPFAIGGNTADDYWAWTPSVGTHTLVATHHAKSRGAGKAGAPRAVTFTVIDSSATPAAPAPAVTPAPTPVVAHRVPAPTLVNAGGGRFADGIGRVFEADSGFTGGATGQANYDVMLPLPYPQAWTMNYTEDPLLLDYRAGANFTFARQVHNGNYAVWIESAEPVAGAAAGQRVFDVSAEGATVLNDYDIVADAGAAQTATAKRFDVTVADGRLDLAFTAVTGEALVGAIAAVPTDIPAAVLPYAGVHGYSDPLKNWAAEEARLVRSASNLRIIGMGVMTFANENKGKLPLDLSVLKQTQEDITLYAFSSPRAASATAMPRGELSLLEQVAWVDAGRDYVYRGAGMRGLDLTTDYWLAYENPDRVPGDRMAVLFGDMHVEYVARAEVVALHGGTGAAPFVARPLAAPAADARVVASQSNLRRIGDAMHRYAIEHRGTYPPDFGSLYPWYLSTPETFVNPRGTSSPPPPAAGATDAEKVAWINASTDYVYRAAALGERREWRYGPDDVVAHENPAGMADGINLLFGDGRVEFREMRWAMETLARPKP